MLNSVLDGSVMSIIWCLLSALALGFVISFTYRLTSKYSKNFLITISLLPLIVCSVIIMVNGNLGTSVAVLGAFSLIRFRSMPGNSKEILIVFLSMSIGLSLGMGQLVFACILTAFFLIGIVLYTKVSLFERNSKEKILKIIIPENLDYEKVFDDIFTKYTSKFSLEMVKTTNMGSLFDLSYNIILKKDVSEQEFIDELRIRNGNLKIILTHPLVEGEL